MQGRVGKGRADQNRVEHSGAEHSRAAELLVERMGLGAPGGI